MTSFKSIFNMITIVNTTNRPLMDDKELIIHNFPFFKEVMIDINPISIRTTFKEFTVAVIIVKDNMIAAKARVDNPAADIYVLAKNTQCVTLVFKGTNGIQQEVESVEAYSVCPSEMINFK